METLTSKEKLFGQQTTFLKLFSYSKGFQDFRVKTIFEKSRDQNELERHSLQNIYV